MQTQMLRTNTNNMSFYTVATLVLSTIISVTALIQQNSFSQTVVNIGSTLYNIQFVPTPTSTGTIPTYDYVILHYSDSGNNLQQNIGLINQQSGQSVWQLTDGISLQPNKILTYSFTYKLTSESVQHDTPQYLYQVPYTTPQYGSTGNGVTYYADIIPSNNNPSAYIFTWQQTASQQIISNIIVHYNTTETVQQNVNMYATNQWGTNWQLQVPNQYIIPKFIPITYSFTIVQPNGIQHDTLPQTKYFSAAN